VSADTSAAAGSDTVQIAALPPGLRSGSQDLQPSRRASRGGKRVTVQRGDTLMNLAARCGALNCVRELHARGAALDAADWGGFTPLINAAWRGDANMVRWLVGAGAALTQRGTSQGQGPFTAAEWAVRRGHGHVYTLLRQAEAARRDDEAAATIGVAPTPKKRRSA
jgi:ankyrin repeat protein